MLRTYDFFIRICLWFGVSFGISKHLVVTLQVISHSINYVGGLKSIIHNRNDYQKKKKDIFYKLISEINRHEINSLLSMASKNIEINSVGLGTWNGQEEAHQLLSCLFQSFPDLFINPLTLLSNDDKDGLIISEVNLEGRQRAASMEILHTIKEFRSIVFLFLNLTSL